MYSIPQTSKKPLKGFTLAELLITLLILAEIATFSIPKILYASQQQKKVALLKEAIGTLSQIYYLGYIQGTVRAGYNGSYLMTNMNAVKLCNTNANTEGCWPQSGAENTEAGMVLHNGTTITGLNDNGGTMNALVVDWDGAAGNNTQGDDQIYMQMCYGNSACVTGGSTIRPGTIGPAGASNITLYQTVFQ